MLLIYLACLLVSRWIVSTFALNTMLFVLYSLFLSNRIHFDFIFNFLAGTVDVVTFSYALTMIPDWRAAIRNAFRMLKPGGHIAVCDFTVTKDQWIGMSALWTWIFRFTFHPSIHPTFIFIMISIHPLFCHSNFNVTLLKLNPYSSPPSIVISAMTTSILKPSTFLHFK